jgi:hypothetical protein
MMKLKKVPAPVFVVGIDIETKSGYVVQITEATGDSLVSISLAHPLDCVRIKESGSGLTNNLMSEPVELYIEQRAETLAREFLTRSPEVDLHPFDGKDINFIVTLHSGAAHQSAGFMGFGAMVKGTVRELADERAASRYLASLTSHPKLKAKRPVCFLPTLSIVFSTKLNIGYYAWVSKPDIINEKPILSSAESFDCKQIDQDSLDEIIEQIRSWYDLLAVELIAQR